MTDNPNEPSPIDLHPSAIITRMIEEDGPEVLVDILDPLTRIYMVTAIGIVYQSDGPDALSDELVDYFGWSLRNDPAVVSLAYDVKVREGDMDRRGLLGKAWGMLPEWMPFGQGQPDNNLPQNLMDQITEAIDPDRIVAASEYWDDTSLVEAAKIVEWDDSAVPGKYIYSAFARQPGAQNDMISPWQAAMSMAIGGPNVANLAPEDQSAFIENQFMNYLPLAAFMPGLIAPTGGASAGGIFGGKVAAMISKLFRTPLDDTVLKLRTGAKFPWQGGDGLMLTQRLTPLASIGQGTRSIVLGGSAYGVATGVPTAIAEAIDEYFNYEANAARDLEAAAEAFLTSSLEASLEDQPMFVDATTHWQTPTGGMTPEMGERVNVVRTILGLPPLSTTTGPKADSAYPEGATIGMGPTPAVQGADLGFTGGGFFEPAPNQQEEAYADDPFIGYETKGTATREVSPGNIIYRGTRYTPFAGDQDPMQDWYSEPTYKHSDAVAMIGNMPPDQASEFEAQAILAGLIDPDGIIGGVAYVPDTKGPHFEQAVWALLQIANRSQEQDWELVLDRMVRANQNQIKQNRLPFEWHAYQPQDPAAIREGIRNDVEARTGRKVRDWELNLLLSEAQALEEQAFHHNQNIAYQEYLRQGKLTDAWQREQQAGLWEKAGYVTSDPKPSDIGGPLWNQAQGRPAERPPGTVPYQLREPLPASMDAQARFAELFRKRFENEIDRKKRTDAMPGKTQNLMSGIARMAGMLERR